VESFDDYRRLYGDFAGPGLLPYAVASFFEQGGQRAYIARIVHDYDEPAQNAAGVASGIIPGTKTPLRLLARNEGSWGNGLLATLSFSTRPLLYEHIETTGLTLAEDAEVSAGALLRLTLPGGVRVLRFVAGVVRLGRALSPGAELRVTFTEATSVAAESLEVVEATLALDDDEGRSEQHERLGLSPRHPRWLATVLCNESQLIYPDPIWINTDLEPTNPDLFVEPATSPQFTGGSDRYADITPEDFFDATWTFGDDEPGDGVHALTALSDLSLLAVPDLYSPAPLVPVESINDPVSLVGAEFARCVDVPLSPVSQEVAIPDLEKLQLDPKLPDDLRQIIEYQTRLVELAEYLRSFVVLLDVPPGLTHKRTLAWRASFNSSYAAAYHPWLLAARRDDRRDALVRIPPSAVAAGIIAQRELTFGVQHGPANVLAAEVVDVAELVSPARHDELHTAGINVYLRERDGIRLTAARTLSRDPAYRQLSVRRLVTMIRRTLEQRMQWSVFEPNNSSLRAEVRHLLQGYLRQLFTAGAFRGATEDEAFFIRCDEVLNSPRIIDAGQLIAEVGIAPAEPIEFILLRLTRDGDGTLTMQEQPRRGREA
jgi:hypothetical protein